MAAGGAIERSYLAARRYTNGRAFLLYFPRESGEIAMSQLAVGSRQSAGAEIQAWSKDDYDLAGEGPAYWGRRLEHGGTMVIHPIRGCLGLRLDLANHSPTGFDWGYANKGSCQLALAMLADAVGDTLALELYADFTAAVIAWLPDNEWIIPRADVVEWIRYELLAGDELDQRWGVREDAPSQARADRTDDDLVELDVAAVME
jgi:hypothetical protein